MVCKPKNATKAPAIQLSEHAQAILEDDARLGIKRQDPVLERIANGSSHAAPLPDFFSGFDLVSSQIYNC